jgi:hypothetical protein
MKMTACNVDLLACVRPSDAGRDGSPGGFDTQMALLRCMLDPCPEEACGMRLGDSPGSVGDLWTLRRHRGSDEVETLRPDDGGCSIQIDGLRTRWVVSACIIIMVGS